ncbi:MAG: EamA family transporter RarD [Desulfobacteraceae bacterium]|nr:EamA family transporter RarD [Desulfobacteraceae bacterium]MBC2751000.1 EamA family transporter RarD [Desulfobacteraceae bacterium]
MPRQTQATDASDSPQGIALAASAFLIWGLSPVYWKALASVPAFEVLMHRMIWSFVFLAPIVLLQGHLKDLIGALTSGRTLLILLLTTLIVSINWFLYIWAINSDHILQASLGYYIAPLVNVLLGFVFLKERLRRLQLVAVGLAAAGVTYLTLSYGQFPWVALALAFSFGFYGLIRKVASVGPLVGLTVETLLLSIPATAYLLYLDHAGRGAFLHDGTTISLMLMGAALVTGLPLLLFTMGAKLLRLATVGFLQYTAPSCTFLLAVFVYHEPLLPTQLLTFGLIWTALAIYSYDSVISHRRVLKSRYGTQMNTDKHR